MTQDQANRDFAWIPAVFATAGGFFGGVLSYRWIRAGMNVLRARMRICWISAVILLATAAVPLMPHPALAAAAISSEFFLDAGHQHQRVCAADRPFRTGSRRPGGGGTHVFLRIDDRVSFALDRQRGGPRGLYAGVHGTVCHAPARCGYFAMDTNRPVSFRVARFADLAAIAAIQAASPEAAQWNPADYLKHDCRVADVNSCVAGFLVTRQVAPGETRNPEFSRRSGGTAYRNRPRAVDGRARAG